MDKQKLLEDARKVLDGNDLGLWTQPAPGLYPHQWLWDSAFIAIGWRHIDTNRAKEEIRTLLRSQWYNGMIPHVNFSSQSAYHAGPSLWKANVSPNCPPHILSTGISQPPVIAEAVVRIGEKLSYEERKEWYNEVYPSIAKFHEWLYRNRDPERTGLVVIVHPWETGMDNNPPWMELLHNYVVSNRLWLMENLGLTKFIERFRKDTDIVPAEERMSTYDLHAVYEIAQQLRHLKYDDGKILKKQKILVQDLAYNSILIRANSHLAAIADEVKRPLPKLVKRACERGVGSLDELWDSEAGEYYSKDYNSKELIKVSCVGSFLPLYAGGLAPERTKILLEHMNDPLEYGTDYAVPSTPVNSSYFKPHCYWQGPVWINMNWLIVQGLKQNNMGKEADKLQKATLELVSEKGMNEYFSPLDGQAAGAPRFSWTAALVIDMLQ